MHTSSPAAIIFGSSLSLQQVSSSMRFRCLAFFGLALLVAGPGLLGSPALAQDLKEIEKMEVCHSQSQAMLSVVRAKEKGVTKGMILGVIEEGPLKTYMTAVVEDLWSNPSKSEAELLSGAYEVCLRLIVGLK